MGTVIPFHPVSYPFFSHLMWPLYGLQYPLGKRIRVIIIDSTGDNVSSEFASVVDAVECAVNIQEELKTRNEDLPENRRMEFRIGVHHGDVIEEEDRIYGDGVNMAARIEGLADGGGICLFHYSFNIPIKAQNNLALGKRLFKIPFLIHV